MYFPRLHLIDIYTHFNRNRIRLHKLLCNCYFSNVLFSYAIIRNDLLIVSSRNQLQNSSSKKKKVKHQMENWKIFRAAEPVWETLGLASSSVHSLSLPSWFLSTILFEHLLHPSLRIKKFLCIYIYLRPKVEYFYFLDSFFFFKLCPFPPFKRTISWIVSNKSYFPVTEFIHLLEFIHSFLLVSLRSLCYSFSNLLFSFFFWKIIFFIYLAEPGLSCSMTDLHCGMQTLSLAYEI